MNIEEHIENETLNQYENIENENTNTNELAQIKLKILMKIRLIKKIQMRLQLED